MVNADFNAIDLETATPQRASICEIGLCAVRNGKVVETRSWLVRPEGNRYSYWNMQIHGIRPEDTADAPEFAQAWAEVGEYLDECPVLVAHNAAFDIGCLRHAVELHGLPKNDLPYYCSLRAARRIYKLGCNTLDYLCDQFGIYYERHHRAADDAEMCARLFLRELDDAGVTGLDEMQWCGGRMWPEE